MTRARHVTPGRTAERMEKIRKLVTALQEGQLPHDQVGPMLELGPSGVRKYLMDLRGKVQLTVDRGERVLRLAMTSDAARAYLDSLTPKAPTSGRKGRVSELALAERDPRRHIHIMQDDEYYQVRVSRSIPAPDPLVVALFGAGRMEARV
jgi:predicted transcriptional regulator